MMQSQNFIQVSIRCLGNMKGELTHFYISPNDKILNCLVNDLDFQSLNDDVKSVEEKDQTTVEQTITTKLQSFLARKVNERKLKQRAHKAIITFIKP